MHFASLCWVLLVLAFQQSDAAGVGLDDIGQKTLAVLSDICPDARPGFFFKGLCLIQYLRGLPKICRPTHIMATCDGPIMEQLRLCTNPRSHDFIIHLTALSKVDKVLCTNGDVGLQDLFKKYEPLCITESIFSCSNPLLPIIDEFMEGSSDSPTFYSPENCRRMKETDCLSDLSICDKKPAALIRKLHNAYLNATCGPDYVH